MRIFFKALSAIAVILMIGSCQFFDKKYKVVDMRQRGATTSSSISGKTGEVVVVIGQTQWEGEVGSALRELLTDEYPMLPQIEPRFVLKNVNPGNFNQMLQVHRNIIYVKIGSEVITPGIRYHRNIWAAPQCYIEINSPTSFEAAELIRKDGERIIETLESIERERVVMNSKKYEDTQLTGEIKKMAGGTPHIPSRYKLKKLTDDFAWISCDLEFSTQGILIYKYPVVKGENMMSPKSLIANNKKILNENVPGMRENTYMTHSSAIEPYVQFREFKDREFAEMRGLWDVYNDYMGGPFIAHIMYSPDGKYMVGVEGFVYAPKQNKRDLLREVEAIVYSFEWDKLPKRE